MENNNFQRSQGFARFQRKRVALWNSSDLERGNQLFFSFQERTGVAAFPVFTSYRGPRAAYVSRYRSSRPRCIRNFSYPFLFFFLPRERNTLRGDSTRYAPLRAYRYNIYLISSREKGCICQTRRLGRENLIFPAHAPRLFLIVERGRASRRHFLAREEKEGERERETTARNSEER